MFDINAPTLIINDPKEILSIWYKKTRGDFYHLYIQLPDKKFCWGDGINYVNFCNECTDDSVDEEETVIASIELSHKDKMKNWKISTLNLGKGCFDLLVFRDLEKTSCESTLNTQKLGI